MSHKRHYRRFLAGLGDKLHFCAHSHHPWPDCSRDAQLQAWEDAAAHVDEKWDKVFGEILPAAQRHAAAAIGWPDPSLLAFAPNTHEFVVRLLSCLPAGRPPKILTTDSEFHSFAREAARLEEDGATVVRVPVEPFDSFAERMSVEAAKEHDFVFFSQVFFNSGLRLTDAQVAKIASSASKASVVVVDGYHAFMAVPTNLSAVSSRAFYLAGGYKYAQAGEGSCFLAVPKGCELRPRHTGWFSDFSALQKPMTAPVGYGAGGMRFFGSTFDPTSLYRFNAVMEWRRAEGLGVEETDAWVKKIKNGFLERARIKGRAELTTTNLISTDAEKIGHFVTFRIPDAAALSKRLAEEKGILTDARADRLRFGFGLYHDEADLDELFRRL